MKKFFVLMILLALVFGCANPQPTLQRQGMFDNPKASESLSNRPIGKYDGRWESAADRGVWVYMAIKHNIIVGYVTNSRWRVGFSGLPIRGKIVDDKFIMDTVHHPDYSETFEMEVKNATEYVIDTVFINERHERFNVRFNKMQK